MANLSPDFIALFISMVVFGLVWLQFSQSKFLIIMASIFAVITTSYYNLAHNPHLIIWLCNFTILMGLFLCFRFQQVVFDVFFYFCWTGSLMTLLIFDNPVAPSKDTYPVEFIGFILKHSIPLILTIHLIKNDNRQLSGKALKTSLSVMLGYAIVVAVYNIIFDQNILDLRYPTLNIERAFGQWPIYVIVNIILAAGWYKTIEIITKKLGLIQTI